MDKAADRGAYIDQSQSFNVHMSDPNFGKLTSLHFYTWRKGLKTGMYYLRTRAAADAIKFRVDQQALQNSRSKKVRNCDSAFFPLQSSQVCVQSAQKTTPVSEGCQRICMGTVYACFVQLCCAQQPRIWDEAGAMNWCYILCIHMCRCWV